MSHRSPDGDVPLCVDCDGSLLRTDLLHEGLLLLVKQAPAALVLLPLWLLRGKAHLKARIAERVRFQWPTLPFCDRVLARVREARSGGRRVVLATASPRAWAEGVAAQAGGFDEVLASGPDLNLSGSAKAQALVARFGDRGFDYVGDSPKDVPVWARARQAIVVSSNRRLVARAGAVTTVAEVIPGPEAGALAYLTMIRVHQWLKNLLVFVPIAAAHRLSSSAALADAGVAFLAFSLCASSVYLLNDLLDLEADRQHVRKRRRAIASGRIPTHHAALLTPLFLVASIGLCAGLPPAFGAVLAVYLVMTLAYSLRLKRQIVVDLAMLAALYTLRVVAGAVATGVTPSFWLLAFSMFLFFSLAVVKRYSEMRIVAAQHTERAAGRGYHVGDLPMLAALGVSSGMAAALVIALYVNDAEVRRLHASAVWLWFIPPLVLYWISRVWTKAHRGEVDDDPVVFAVRDWQSLLTVGLILACFVLASRP